MLHVGKVDIVWFLSSVSDRLIFGLFDITIDPL